MPCVPPMDYKLIFQMRRGVSLSLSHKSTEVVAATSGLYACILPDFQGLLFGFFCHQPRFLGFPTIAYQPSHSCSLAARSLLPVAPGNDLGIRDEPDARGYPRRAASTRSRAGRTQTTKMFHRRVDNIQPRLLCSVWPSRPGINRNVVACPMAPPGVATTVRPG